MKGLKAMFRWVWFLKPSFIKWFKFPFINRIFCHLTPIIISNQSVQEFNLSTVDRVQIYNFYKPPKEKYKISTFVSEIDTYIYIFFYYTHTCISYKKDDIWPSYNFKYLICNHFLEISTTDTFVYLRSHRSKEHEITAHRHSHLLLYTYSYFVRFDGQIITKS